MQSGPFTIVFHNYEIPPIAAGFGTQYMAPFQFNPSGSREDRVFTIGGGSIRYKSTTPQIYITQYYSPPNGIHGLGRTDLVADQPPPPWTIIFAFDGTGNVLIRAYGSDSVLTTLDTNFSYGDDFDIISIIRKERFHSLFRDCKVYEYIFRSTFI